VEHDPEAFRIGWHPGRLSLVHVTMGVVTDQPAEDEQPIIPMLDLSGAEEPAQPETGPGTGERAEPSRLRMVGGILLLFSALGLVVALVLPLYRIGLTESANSPESRIFGGFWAVNAWGAIDPNSSSPSIAQIIQEIVGNTPVWGVPLIVAALLVAVAGAVALWRPGARYVASAALVATALLVGCFAMLAEFVVTAVNVSARGPIDGQVGAGFWLILFAVVFAIGGVGAVLRGRSEPLSPVAPPERDETPTPPMGFPAPVVLPELDGDQ
jgi:hypothetical protein